jgi:hypothetical protein
MIHNAAVEDGRMTAKARGVLVYLLSRPVGWSTSSDKLARSEAFQREGRDAIREALKELEEFGYLVRNRSQKPDGTWEWNQMVTDQPTMDGLSGDGLSDDGSSDDGKPVDINKKEINNKDSVLTSPSSSPSVTRGAPLPAEDHMQRFEQWWGVFPKSVRKPETLVEYHRAWNSGVSHDELLEAAKGYQRQITLDGTEHRYIASSVAWLQGERWKDKYPPAPVPKAKLHPLQRSVAE